MRARPKTVSDARQPGPGAYEVENFQKNIKGAGLGKNVRDTSVDLKSVYSPGPGQLVSVAKEAARNNGPKYGFGSESRDKGYIQKAK